MNNFAEIKRLWLEFYQLSFPSELYDKEVKGICLISLDTFTAGCIDTFLDSNGLSDEKLVGNLQENQKNLEVVVNNLIGEGKSYFEKLLVLTNKILIIDNEHEICSLHK